MYVWRKCKRKTVPCLLLLVIVALVTMNNLSGLAGLTKADEYSQKTLRWKKSTNITSLADDRVYSERRQIAEDYCASNVPQRRWKPRGFLHKRQPVFYCKIPKVASTFMLEYLPKVFQSTSMRDIFHTVEKMSARNMKIARREIIEDSFSYVFVREPYRRLFSAYENKLYLPNKFWDKLGTDVIRTVRAPPVSIDTGHDVTFTEFLEYVIAKYHGVQQMNEHLEPMHTRCDPCSAKFDFIGKIETMGSDIENLVKIWRKIGYIDDTNVHESASNARELEAKTKSELYYGPVDKLFEKVETRLFRTGDLFRRTWTSYQIRGLIHCDLRMPFENEATIENVNREDFRKALERAIETSKVSTVELQLQREEALVQAYNTVPVDLMMQVRTFVLRDCRLFGYDDMPDTLFRRDGSVKISNFNYFKGLPQT